MQRTVLLSQLCSSLCQTRVLWQNWMMHCGYFDTAPNGNHSSFLTPTLVGGRCPLPCQKFAESDPHPLLKITAKISGTFVCGHGVAYIYAEWNWTDITVLSHTVHNMNMHNNDISNTFVIAAGDCFYRSSTADWRRFSRNVSSCSRLSLVVMTWFRWGSSSGLTIYCWSKWSKLT